MARLFARFIKIFDLYKRKCKYYLNHSSIFSLFFVMIIVFSLFNLPSLYFYKHKKIYDVSPQNEEKFIGFKSKLNEYTTHINFQSRHHISNYKFKSGVNLKYYYLKILMFFGYKISKFNSHRWRNRIGRNMRKLNHIFNINYSQPHTLFQTLDYNKSLQKCRNTYQGPFFLADELGFVCELNAVKNGCCFSNLTIIQDNFNGNASNLDVKLFANSTRFVCESCNKLSHCCNHFEHCVSCCLKPDNKHIIDEVLNHWWTNITITKNKEGWLDGHDLALSQSHDYFEACLTSCRTSSRSVIHENSYRNPKSKYCFGIKMPTINIGQSIIPNSQT